MRIIAGRFRRRKLRSNPGTTTRPMTDFAKESLFEHLGGEIEADRVLDVFSGTGTLGFEALSRGAKQGMFIEKNPTACELLRKNASDLELGDEIFCWQTDVLRCSFRPKGEESRYPYDLVFFDPPYKMASALAPGRSLFRALERLAREVTTDSATLMVRVPSREVITLPDAWPVFHELEISGMRMLLCTKRAEWSPDVAE